MKIIHTADWHLGQTLRQYDRSDEHQHFFDQLVGLVACERPDALLVCGDVFHTATPSNATVKMYTDNMIRLHEACNEMKIIVIAGNHDSPSRLESTGEVWKLANVAVVGAIEHTDGGYDIGKHIIKVADKGYVVAIPDVNERYNDIFGIAQNAVDELNGEKLPVVMMAHLAVKGCDPSGHRMERSTEVGGKAMVAPDEMTTSACDYVALGHIHHPQTLNTPITTRYSGSVLHVNFDERFPHSVSVVTIGKHGEKPEIKEVKIHQKRHLYIVPKEPLPVDEALAQLSRFNPDEPGYLRLDVKVKGYAPNDLEDRVMRLLNDKPQLRFCFVNNVTERTENSNSQLLGLNADELKQASPDDVFNVALNYCEEKKNHSLDEEQKLLLKGVVEQVMREQAWNRVEQ